MLKSDHMWSKIFLNDRQKKIEVHLMECFMYSLGSI